MCNTWALSNTESSCVVQPPRFEFYDPQTPIYTSPRFLPPAKVVKSKINDAIISHGSYLEECTVSNAIIGLRSRIDKGAVIQVSLSLPPSGCCHLPGPRFSLESGSAWTSSKPSAGTLAVPQTPKI